MSRDYALMNFTRVVGGKEAHLHDHIGGWGSKNVRVDTKYQHILLSKSNIIIANAKERFLR